MEGTATTGPHGETDRTGISVEALKRAIMDNLFYIQGKFPAIATWNDWYLALAYAVRERLLHQWIATTQTFMKKNQRVVCYLSAEFLNGPQLLNNIVNLDMSDAIKQAAEELGLDFDDLVAQEQEPGLGNGGLGRLAACFIDSLSTLKVPALGYGIRYEYGIFNQLIRNGVQVESTDSWLRLGNPWEIPRPERAFEVKFGGHTEAHRDKKGRYRVKWVPEWVISGVPYDTPIPGYHNGNANTLRLWKAEACESFDFAAFNEGDYFGSVQDKITSENLTKVLYPNDVPLQGRRLRLQQQFFFVTCSLQDLIAMKAFHGLEDFHEKVTIQLNDTHPSIGVAELMRLLLDEHEMDWDKAWHITENTFAYTNHTLLPEALERWSVPLFGDLLPRHLEIIYEINRRFLEVVKEKFPGDDDRVRRMSLIDESGEKYVRMAHLACVGSHAINGVAALHSDLLTKYILKDFYELWPHKFHNVTNGVTPRRWILVSNPRMSKLITSRIGGDWATDTARLKELEPLAEDADFRKKWQTAKRQNKRRLVAHLENVTGIPLDVDSLFDVQVKRIHEYKRQHLNVLHIITLFNRIKKNPEIDIVPRTFIFGGKAAPAYFMAKLIIQLVTAVGSIVNRDKDVNGRLKVVFVPNFDVTQGQLIYPAADLSEQISLAGKEASGTGNMKFSFNGALTIGTLDGANVEIREEVGPENFFLFGLNEQEVMRARNRGYYPIHYYLQNYELKAAMDRISSGYFSNGDPAVFAPLVDSLMHHDEYMLLADYQSYIECQEAVSAAYRNQEEWTKKAILNVARMGKFSSDRSISEYCDRIWHVKPIDVDLSVV